MINQQKTIKSAFIILSLALFIVLDCGGVVSDFVGTDDTREGLDPNAPLPPSLEELECPEPTRDENDPVSVSFLGSNSNVYEGERKDDNSRKDGVPVPIKLCFDPLPTLGLGVEYQITQETGVILDTDYRVTFADELGDSGFLYIREGEEGSLLEVAAIGDANNSPDDAGSFVIKILPGEGYELGNPSEYMVEILEPVEILVQFTQAASRFNEDDIDPHLIVVASDIMGTDQNSPVETVVRFQVTNSTTDPGEYELTGAVPVPEMEGHYDLIIPANTVMASIRINTAIDIDRDPDTLSFALLDTDTYNLGAQTSHTTTIASRQVTGLERVGHFTNSSFANLANNRKYNGIAIAPDGSIYLAHSNRRCIRKYQFTEGATEAESTLTGGSPILADGNVGQGLGGDRRCGFQDGAHLYRSSTDDLLTQPGRLETAVIGGKNYLFVGDLATTAPSFLVYAYDEVSGEYESSNFLDNFPVSTLDVGVDVANHKIFLSLEPYRTFTIDYSIVNEALTIGGNQITVANNPGVIATGSIEWRLLLPPGQQNLGTTNSELADVIAVNPHNSHIYVSESNSLGMPDAAHNRIFVFKYDAAVSSDLKWRHLWTFNPNGGRGNQPHRVSNVSDIIIGVDGAVYIVERGNGGRIKVYDAHETGALLRHRFNIDINDLDPQYFVNTDFITMTIDSNNRIYVSGADSANSDDPVLQVYKPLYGNP